MFIKNVRFHGGIETSTDHKLVKMEMKTTWQKLKYTNIKIKQIDVEKLEYTIYREKYYPKTTKNYLEKQRFENLQEQWDHILNHV